MPNPKRSPRTTAGVAPRATRRMLPIIIRGAGGSSAPPNSSSGRRRDIFARYGLTRIINASGTETTKGASPVCPEVMGAVNALVPHSVDMFELQSAACHVIADAFETEAGLVVNCSAAGIVAAVAACMAGEDFALAQRLPDPAGMKHEVILQCGHNIDYGAPITRNVMIAGAKVVGIGTANGCEAHHLAGAITPRTAAALYVVSHHTVQSGLIDLETFCRICRKRKVPVIVDAAAEPEPRLFLRAGADLVIVSMHKQFASLTAGVLAGRLDLVRACLLHEKGLCRPMKVGKEAVIATIAALERWSARDHRKIAANLDARLVRGHARLTRLPGIAAEIEPDSSSHLFSRLLLKIDPAKAGFSAGELADRLAAQRPSIAVRSLTADIGLLRIDLRLASAETADHIITSIEKIAAGVGTAAARRSLLRRKIRNFPLPMGG